jgi:hypothetical protein
LADIGTGITDVFGRPHDFLTLDPIGPTNFKHIVTKGISVFYLKATSVNWGFDGCNMSFTGNMEDTKK